jgi:predicted nucleotidyltransferase
MDDIKAMITTLLPRLRALGVAELFVFGSAAMDRLQGDSDVDFIVRFVSVDFETEHYFDVLFLLEDSLGREVDLAVPETLHPRIRERVFGEMKRVA